MVDIYVGPESTHWVLHEKLLCHHSPFFRSIFYSKKEEAARTKTFGLPETDDAAFELFVGWLYSRALRYPVDEAEIGPLLDLYLLAEKYEVEALGGDVVETVRAWYHNNETYPGLRRVQYVYANTAEDNVMREMMVGAVARYLTLSERIPGHWERALRKNGQLAVDIIRSIQEWHLEGRSVPDAREGSAERGRGGVGRDGEGRVGFSAVDGRRGGGAETETGTNTETNGHGEGSRDREDGNENENEKGAGETNGSKTNGDGE